MCWGRLCDLSGGIWLILFSLKMIESSNLTKWQMIGTDLNLDLLSL